MLPAESYWAMLRKKVGWSSCKSRTSQKHELFVQKIASSGFELYKPFETAKTNETRGTYDTLGTQVGYLDAEEARQLAPILNRSRLPCEE